MQVTFLCDPLCPLWLDFLFRKLDRQIQRARNPIRQVRQSNQHMQVNDLLIGEVFLQFCEADITGTVGRAREFLGVAKRSPFLLPKGE